MIYLCIVRYFPRITYFSRGQLRSNLNIFSDLKLDDNEWWVREVDPSAKILERGTNVAALLTPN